MVSYKALNTTSESILPYARHTIGDSNRGQTRATRESIIPYARHTIGDSNRGQTRATIESTIPYARHTIGDSNRGQTRAFIESSIPYARNSLILFCSFVISYDICTLKYDTKTYLYNNSMQYYCKSTPTEVFITN